VSAKEPVSQDTPSRLPVEVAIEVLGLCVRRYGSPRAVAIAYSTRFDCDIKGAEKVLRRIRLRTQPQVTVDMMDRLCTLAGTHLAHYDDLDAWNYRTPSRMA